MGVRFLDSPYQSLPYLLPLDELAQMKYTSKASFRQERGPRIGGKRGYKEARYGGYPDSTYVSTGCGDPS